MPLTAAPKPRKSRPTRVATHSAPDPGVPEVTPPLAAKVTAAIRHQ